MAEMPGRITAFSVSPLKSGGYWSTAPQPPMEAISDYIRADLVDDLVKALEEAREEFLYWHPDCGPGTPLQDQSPAGPSRVVAKIDAALTRIKGDVT